ncbi:MAG: porin family protein [Planctomycetota bacterium]
MNRNGTLVVLAILASTAGGCLGWGGDLEFTDSGDVFPCARAEAEVRMYKSGFDRWDFPAFPGTPEAERRERYDPMRGNSLFFRAEVDVSSHVVDGSDFSPWLEYIYTVPLDPGTVRSRMRINQEELLLRVGWCTRRRIFRIGGGLNCAGVQMSGSVSDPDSRISIDEDVFGFGLGAMLEVSPGFPPLRAYLDVRFLPWFHDRISGSVEICEVGVKMRYFGILVFFGYRWETVERDVDDLLLSYHTHGPVLGLGFAF